MVPRDPKEARDVRRLIAKTFEALERHELTLSELILTPPAHTGNCEIHELLRRAPKMGDRGAEKCLKDAKVWPLTKLKNLRLEDKQAVIAHLPPRVRTELRVRTNLPKPRDL